MSAENGPSVTGCRHNPSGSTGTATGSARSTVACPIPAASSATGTGLDPYADSYVMHPGSQVFEDLEDDIPTHAAQVRARIRRTLLASLERQEQEQRGSHGRG
jgi:hypothetical protein